MEDSNNRLDSELKSFREQWLSEVRTRKGDQNTQPKPCTSSSASTAPSASPPSRNPAARQPSPARTRKAPSAAGEEDECLRGPSFDDGPEPSRNAATDAASRTAPERELVSALDHYEEAMEKEALGKMGDSLKLYRKAYRMDQGVDRRYREKHFPQHSKQQQQQQQPLAAPAAASSTPTQTTASADGAPAAEDSSVALPIKDLVSSFAGLQIAAAPPEIDGAPPRACPLSSLPSELLIHVMQDVAALDVGDFARLSLVCKPLAYLVATEERIWQQVCLGARFGFAGMHHRWSRTVEWEPLEGRRDDADADADADAETTATVTGCLALVPDTYATWKAMFRARPRVRFNGCYISTVNYVRTGQASASQATWGGAPIHIVTYYRYLRFFRDGTAISLLTTSEPTHVVQHLTRDLLHLHRRDTAGSAVPAHPPSAAMQRAHKGRWRLSSPGTGIDADADDASPPSPSPSPSSRAASRRRRREGDLTVETEGVDPKYMFRMDLSLRTAGKAARNNKIVWRSFFSYNNLTDDWAEFTLKHDKPFFFGRVRSYGTGE
ncbi:F-box domain containing protein [Metarhizium album ARSEF 1941]|uniref:F-box domain containing protein n=1 Tax=Metarhizium album (strain ARSEF 1941) TaxID=1081103 RepID=A0A0B2WF71_METAS|nr:F-box domain containing protein [Metarhizium album ARSEF 1941]KHN94556.1 F-box domain containing protein [Metarhizium album ARSEF 1941]